MKRRITYVAGILILFSSFVLVGCPKKVSSVEGSAGLSKGKPTEEGAEKPADGGLKQAPLQEEKLSPLAEEELLSGIEDGAKPVPGVEAGRDQAPASLEEEKLSPLAEEEPLSGIEDGTKPVPGVEAGRDQALASLEDVFFDFDQWLIRPEAKEALQQDARWLAAHPQAKIQIEGHCDERGTNEYNLVLGERRAKSVVNFMVNLGASPSRISVISYGEEKPFCAEQGEVCYQKNRRAHFVLK